MTINYEVFIWGSKKNKIIGWSYSKHSIIIMCIYIHGVKSFFLKNYVQSAFKWFHFYWFIILFNTKWCKNSIVHYIYIYIYRHTWSGAFFILFRVHLNDFIFIDLLCLTHKWCKNSIVYTHTYIYIYVYNKDVG